MIDNTPKNDGLRAFDQKIRGDFNELPREIQDRQRAAPTFILYPFELRENQLKSFVEKDADALDLIYNHLISFKKSFGATSWGMDSVVMVSLILRAWEKAIADGHKVEKPMFFLNDTLNTFKEEKQYWKDIVEFFGIEDNVKTFIPPKDENGRQQTVWTIAEKHGHLPSFRSMVGRGKAFRKTQGDKTEKIIKGGGQTPECCNILKKASLKKYLKGLPEEDRFDLHFIGTRAEESRMRQMSVLQRCRTYLITSMFPYPIRAVTPLAYFTKRVYKKHQCHEEVIEKEITEFVNICICGHDDHQHLDIYNPDSEEEAQTCHDCDCKKYKQVSSKKVKTGKFVSETKWVPNKGETAPEDDIELYYQKYGIPKNPTYPIHNLTRMGCSSCPAHLNWEARLAVDPTNEGFGMLRQNFKIMKETDPERLIKSIGVIQKVLDGKLQGEGKLNESNRPRLEALITEFITVK